MERRSFLKNTAGIAAASLFANPLFSSPYLQQMESIGIQLFSLPKLLEKDFRTAIQLLAQMGYKELELYGPYTFSIEEAKTRWKAISNMVGFSGSGYFGHSSEEVKTILEEYGMKASAAHTDLGTLQKNMNELGEAGQALGFEYVGLPAIPEENRKTLDDYKRTAEAFNKMGAAAKKVGLKFAYHNHGYGLKEVNGQIPLQLIFELTDPDLVFFEMDIFWTAAGGANPVDYLNAYPGRYHLMHLKDMKEKVQFASDGGSPSEWIPLFPYMASAGDGVFDLEAIVKAGEKSGVKHFYVEQDMVAQPEVALKKSIDYLGSL